MTPRQRRIADEAITRKKAQTYQEIQEEVSRVTGIDLAEVKEALDHLVSEHILKEAATPAHNVLEGPRPPGQTTSGWYEKGGCWPKD